MLIYHPESDALFWDPEFTFEGSDGALCSDVSEELWAVERAQDEGIEFPEIERHLAYLRDIQENSPPPNECAYCNATGWFYGDKELGLCGCGAGVSDPDDEYWQGL